MKNPSFRWTVKMAPVMTIAGPSAARRVSAPTSTPRPPKNSPTMTRTVSDAGMPFFANRAMVPLKPDLLLAEGTLAPPGSPLLECFTTIATLIPTTTRLRFLQTVACNSFRHPGLLAKMVATLDVISNGRMELGIGAGWLREEYDAYG